MSDTPKLLSMPDCAKLFGLPLRKTREHLRALHRERGNILVVVGEGRQCKYFTTEGALRNHLPQLFAPRGVEMRVEKLEEEVLFLRKRLASLAARLRTRHDDTG